MFPWLSIPEGFILNCLSMALITVWSRVNIWIINVFSVTVLWTVPVVDELKVSKQHLRVHTSVDVTLEPTKTSICIQKQLATCPGCSWPLPHGSWDKTAQEKVIVEDIWLNVTQNLLIIDNILEHYTDHTVLFCLLLKSSVNNWVRPFPVSLKLSLIKTSSCT